MNEKKTEYDRATVGNRLKEKQNYCLQMFLLLMEGIDSHERTTDTSQLK